MIKKHLDGLNLSYSLKKQYDQELELVCLNSEYFDISLKLSKAQELANEYPERVVLKESEFHEESAPYYEVYLFCNKDEVFKFETILNSYGLELDLIHNND